MPTPSKPPKKNPAAQSLGRLGGLRNTPAQAKARAINSKLAGRPGRICAHCGEAVYGGHKNSKQNRKCDGRTWEWQKPRDVIVEARAVEAGRKRR